MEALYSEVNFTSKNTIRLRDGSKISTADYKGGEVIFIDYNGRELDILGLMIYSIGNNYTGKSSRDIKIGSTISEVVKAYGQDFKTFSSGKNTYLIFKKTGISFKIN